MKSLRLVIIFSAVLIVLFFFFDRYTYKQVSVDSTIMPHGSSSFPGIPINFLGEAAIGGEYEITLTAMTLNENRLSLNISLSNFSEQDILLADSLHIYSDNNFVYLPTNHSQQAILPAHSSNNFVVEYTINSENVEELELVYMPRGYSGAIFIFFLFERPEGESMDSEQNLEEENEIEETGVYGTTGDPWKMLVLIYPNIDTEYIDLNGTTRRLTASMPSQDLQNMKNSFLNLPHRQVVHDYSGQAAELEAHIIVVDRPLTSLEQIYNGYWPSPEITRPELNEHAPKGKYDSVIIFWQASDPNSSQSIPNGGGWGWGYWPGETYANGMTYATVYNISYVWTQNNQACRGEVFLHEWLHGVTGFYMSKGVPFNYEDLHGAEENTTQDYVYFQRQTGCWDVWLRDYMRGMVYEDGVRKALVPEISWHKGSITTYTINGWRGEYYNNQTLNGIPVMVRNDPVIDFEWLLGSPHPLVNNDGFSVRWTRQIYFEEGNYKFDLFRDDGIRLKIDGVTVLENWGWGREWISITTPMTAGNHTVQVESYEIDGYSSAVFQYTKLSTSIGDAYEPDNDSTQAKWIYSGSPQVHSIVPATDVDWMKFTLASTSAITIETSGDSASDTRMWLYDSSLSEIEYDDDDGNGFYSLIERVCGSNALPAGTYYVKIDEFGNNNEIPAYTINFNVTQTCADASTFADVPFNHSAWQYIEAIYNAGITGGCTINPLNYCPNNTVTRAQMAIFLLRGMHGSAYTPPAVGDSTGFNDVPTTHSAAAWIKQLAAEGITGGCGSGNYCPNSPVTRAQMAIFLLRAKYDKNYVPPAVGGSSGFNDVPAGSSTAPWIKQLAAEGITGGCGGGNYCPNNPVTRAQMAIFLQRTFNLPLP